MRILIVLYVHLNINSFPLPAGNVLSIMVLGRKDMDLKPVFRQILVTLVSFDIGCIIFNVLLFCLPHLSVHYRVQVFPYLVPVVLPFAQIALTGRRKEIDTINFDCIYS